MLTHAEATTLFERKLEAWLREDTEGYLAFWAEDMTFGSPMHPEPIRGRAAFAELIRSWGPAMRPLRMEVEHLAVEGDTVLSEWTVALAERASEREISWRGMSVAEYRDGLIATWREYWNPADLGLAVSSASPSAVKPEDRPRT